MRKVTDIHRTKEIYNLSVDEVRSGEWIKLIPTEGLIELEYKSHYMVIKCMVDKRKSEKEEKKDGNKTRSERRN